MRLKVTPEDFRVRELLEWDEVRDGGFVVHRLRKSKLSTAEALALIARECDVDRSELAYAGLKDRQAVTEQFVTIPRRAVELKLANLQLLPVGSTDRPITSRQSRGNAFEIVVRDLTPAQGSLLRRNLPSLVKTGFPNYFDDQRFGSVRHGQGFPMRNVLRGDFERALQQLIAEPSPVAITGDVKLKRTLQLRWGDWEACARIARGPAYERLFDHLLAQPDDFRGALEFVPLRTRVIHAFAYQSLLWNRAVSRLLRGGVLSAQRLRIATLAGDLMAWKYLAPEREQKLLAMQTPLYGPDGTGGSEPFRRAMSAELEDAGLTREDFLRNEVPGMVWKEEHRDVLVKPAAVQEVRVGADELHPGRVCAALAFELPRGSYATMLIKRLLAPAWYDDRGDDRPRDHAPVGRPRGRARDQERHDHDGDEDRA
ncbi:MAG: tRNA pseudouridine(13) synthase TruD [Planctomycetes bacterium]|nr:tRNA pseudouridine(13) synthase TruD [Planctomycetota bacterium]